jgi:hypothetical protein
VKTLAKGEAWVEVEEWVVVLAMSSEVAWVKLREV